MKKLLLDLLTFRRESKKYGPGNSHWHYFSRWRRTLDPAKTSLHYGLPWISFQAIEFLDSWLKPGQKVFEFGGGGSSLFFMSKGCSVTTVEHDEKWFHEIAAKFAAQNIASKWKGYLIKPGEKQKGQGSDPANPLDYCSSNKDFLNVSFLEYASKIGEEPDNSLDLVLVDGRARPSCIYHSINKLKLHGLLIIDNTERDYYSAYFLKNFADKFSPVMDQYGPVPYISWFNKTSIWRKEKA